jgi:hypothetical protein
MTSKKGARERSMDAYVGQEGARGKGARDRLVEAFVEEDGLMEIPSRCPVSGGRLYVSELTCEESGVVIRGKFRLPQGAELDEEKQAFLRVFLRARGVISTVEKELGISYPTVRARLDALLSEMGLAPIKDDAMARRNEKRRQVLKDLEDGKLTPEQAKKKLRGIK